MDRVAEYGVAAHAVYKDGRTVSTRDMSESSAYQWLRRMVDNLAESASPEEFLEHTKLELFHDQVFCFSPKGLLIALPRGATSTYGQIASAAGSPAAVRAAGAAIGRNPVSVLVPCHRVLGRDGSLTGYAGGLHRKTALLQAEGVLLA